MIFRELPALPEKVGFDYRATVNELLSVYRAWQIGFYLGYEGDRSVWNIARGQKESPHHKTGERLYILYVETFGKKPPL